LSISSPNEKTVRTKVEPSEVRLWAGRPDKPGHSPGDSGRPLPYITGKACGETHFPIHDYKSRCWRPYSHSVVDGSNPVAWKMSPFHSHLLSKTCKGTTWLG